MRHCLEHGWWYPRHLECPNCALDYADKSRDFKREEMPLNVAFAVLDASPVHQEVLLRISRIMGVRYALQTALAWNEGGER